MSELYRISVEAPAEVIKEIAKLLKQEGDDEYYREYGYDWVVSYKEGDTAITAYNPRPADPSYLYDVEKEINRWVEDLPEAKFTMVECNSVGETV